MLKLNPLSLFKQKSLAPLEKYRIYREVGMKLNHKVMNKCLSSDAPMESGKLMGIVEGDTLIFESEGDTSILADFSLNEYRVNGQTAIEIYKEKFGGRNKVEKDILNALISSSTSLFKVISVYLDRHSILLEDVLKPRKRIELIDIGFSQTAVLGQLLFIRLVEFNDFNMTSGISFAFSREAEGYILDRYRKISARNSRENLGNDSMTRFISFFKLNKTLGLEIKYQ